MLAVKLLIFIFPVLSARNITIHTPDNGNTDSRYQKVSDIYISLVSYGITPSKNGYLKFLVKACNDAFFVLSASSDLTSEDFYEVIIGADINRQIRLRRNVAGHNKQVKSVDSKILSCAEFRLINLSWSGDGLITVGMDSKTILKWTDSSPIQVKGFGIMTAWGANGTWIFEMMCACSCEYKTKLNYWSKQKTEVHTRDEWLEILKPQIEEIKQNLIIDKTMTSSSIRRRRSAKDNRKSSRQMGFVGAFVIIVVILLVILIDLTSFRDIWRRSRRIKGSA